MLISRNVIEAINSRAVPVIRYKAGIGDYTKCEMQKLDKLESC